MENNIIDISVCLFTYYHEKYVSEAVESILSQKTKYTYEIIISDDCSQDKTVDIIKKYQEKYPNIIRTNINATNLGIAENIYKARCMCKGRYLVSCSGDDYFIDEYKLEKQVKYLDEHHEIFGCACRMQIRKDFDRNGKDYPSIKYTGYNYTLKEYEDNIVFPTRGMVIKNIFKEEWGKKYFSIAKDICSKCDEIVENYLILNQGPVYIMPDVMDCYRWITNENRHNYNSIFSTYEKYMHALTLYRGLFDRYGFKTNFSKHFLNHFPASVLWCIKHLEINKLRNVFDKIPNAYRNISFYAKTIVLCVKVVYNYIFLR